MSTTALNDQEITTSLNDLDGWQRDGDSISKTYEFKSYLEGLAFASAAGTVAEGRNHHPDIMIGWRKVTLSFTTHDAGSKITQKDIDAATAIEALNVPRS